jgi:hypothetical protein
MSFQSPQKQRTHQLDGAVYAHPCPACRRPPRRPVRFCTYCGAAMGGAPSSFASGAGASGGDDLPSLTAYVRRPTGRTSRKWLIGATLAAMASAAGWQLATRVSTFSLQPKNLMDRASFAQTISDVPSSKPAAGRRWPTFRKEAGAPVASAAADDGAFNEPPSEATADAPDAPAVIESPFARRRSDVAEALPPPVKMRVDSPRQDPRRTILHEEAAGD